ALCGPLSEGMGSMPSERGVYKLLFSTWKPQMHVFLCIWETASLQEKGSVQKNSVINPWVSVSLFTPPLFLPVCLAGGFALPARTVRIRATTMDGQKQCLDSTDNVLS
ncbi:MAG: hypothetical protein Q4D42_13860, partial [Eubacteriales bacterium]|nr:hypothetical protein [Eubacteriales bacterium]